MRFSWEDSCSAFTDAARWFIQTVQLVHGRWDEAALGEWDVRALVGHTSRSFLTVETYLDRPASRVDVGSAADYFRTTRVMAAGPEVAERGREAGAALGPDPATAVAAIADRVLRLVARRNGTELLTTLVGGMRLEDYLPTRVFELAVHTADLAVVLDVPLDIPPTAGTQVLNIIAELAVTDGVAGPLILAATGRQAFPPGYSLL